MIFWQKRKASFILSPSIFVSQCVLATKVTTHPQSLEGADGYFFRELYEFGKELLSSKVEHIHV